MSDEDVDEKGVCIACLFSGLLLLGFIAGAIWWVVALTR